MRYSLRTLLILTTLGPPLLATAWMHREWPLRQEWTLHFTAGVCFVLLYPVAVLNLFAVFQRLKRPPTPMRLSPLEVAGIALAILAASNAAVFILSGDRP